MLYVTMGFREMAEVSLSSLHSAPISMSAGLNVRLEMKSFRSILARTRAYILCRTFPRQNLNILCTR